MVSDIKHTYFTLSYVHYRSTTTMYGTRVGVRALGLGACASAVAYKLTDTATSDLLTPPSLKITSTGGESPHKLSGSESVPSQEEKFLGKDYNLIYLLISRRGL